MNHPNPLLQPEGRVLPTLEADGSRRWINPRLSTGKWFHRRRMFGFALIAFFVTLPFVQVNGKPIVLLDIIARQFTLFGYTFLPRDTFLLALLMVSWILGIFFFTAVFGRVWCGWACPQTVYMEFVYRPIERLFKGRAGVGGKARAELPAWRVPAMYAAYLVVSFLIANLFLSYFVGVERLMHWMTRSPLEHPTGFVVVAVVTAAMMFDFAFFREQTCVIACPYGRLQSVLLDRQSLVVQYDRARGEPRRGTPLPILSAEAVQPATATTTGDCVACDMCVQVCPTGIDIRDGVQLECIHCTQCMDACDAVMAKVRKPPGLVRYSSQAAAEGQPLRLIRPRVVIYAIIVTGLLSLLSYLIVTKPAVDMLVVRNQGLPFVINNDGRVLNTLRVQITNRTDQPQRYAVSLVGSAGVTLMEGLDHIDLPAQGAVQKPIHLLVDRSAFVAGKHAVTIRISGPGDVAAERTIQLFGPAR
jgi:cytochrome c oxidase accessory protein FixG